ncbi:hypothetical protein [Rhizobium rhizogenes]|uniref:hypothetical protein n=1 Tax=Rhizobium rhizogenes TaxID=359 RepID=UPI0015733792|nr:hypothetical protein [Rhizobium rhizogenes]NTF46621.1 hypothetical protein [Rhizobium rhizogenes]
MAPKTEDFVAEAATSDMFENDVYNPKNPNLSEANQVCSRGGRCTAGFRPTEIIGDLEKIRADDPVVTKILLLRFSNNIHGLAPREWLILEPEGD